MGWGGEEGRGPTLSRMTSQLNWLAGTSHRPSSSKGSRISAQLMRLLGHSASALKTHWMWRSMRWKPFWARTDWQRVMVMTAREMVRIVTVEGVIVGEVSWVLVLME